MWCSRKWSWNWPEKSSIGEISSKISSRPDLKVASTPAAIVCAASLPQEWVWTGTLAELPGVAVPDGLAGVLVIGDVVRVRAALQGAMGRITETEMAATAAVDEVMYGRH